MAAIEMTIDQATPKRATGRPRTVAYSLAATVSQPWTGPQTGASPATRIPSRYAEIARPTTASPAIAAPNRPRAISSGGTGRGRLDQPAELRCGPQPDDLLAAEEQGGCGVDPAADTLAGLGANRRLLLPGR